MINLIYNKQVEGEYRDDYLRVFRRIQHEWQICKPAGRHAARIPKKCCQAGKDLKIT